MRMRRAVVLVMAAGCGGVVTNPPDSEKAADKRIAENAQAETKGMPPEPMSDPKAPVVVLPSQPPQ